MHARLSRHKAGNLQRFPEVIETCNLTIVMSSPLLVVSPAQLWVNAQEEKEEEEEVRPERCFGGIL